MCPLPLPDVQRATDYSIVAEALTNVGAFPEFNFDIEGPETTLTGELPDSAALYGAMARLEALGLDLIDVRRLHDRGSGPRR
jgi:hypothetical protein